MSVLRSSHPSGAAVVVRLIATGARSTVCTVRQGHARLAAEQSDAMAQASLWIMYGTGQGLSQDYVQATCGSTSRPHEALVREERRHPNRSLAVNELTPDALNEAQRLARELEQGFSGAPPSAPHRPLTSM